MHSCFDREQLFLIWNRREVATHSIAMYITLQQLVLHSGQTQLCIFFAVKDFSHGVWCYETQYLPSTEQRLVTTKASGYRSFEITRVSKPLYTVFHYAVAICTNLPYVITGKVLGFLRSLWGHVVWGSVEVFSWVRWEREAASGWLDWKRRIRKDLDELAQALNAVPAFPDSWALWLRAFQGWFDVIFEIPTEEINRRREALHRFFLYQCEKVFFLKITTLSFVLLFSCFILFIFGKNTEASLLSHKLLSVNYFRTWTLTTTKLSLYLLINAVARKRYVCLNMN